MESSNLGIALKAAREEQGVSLEQIAERLKVRPSLVAALEENRFSDLPEPIYTRAYLQRYAQLVHLDPAPFVTAYDRHANFTQGQKVVVPKPERSLPPRQSWRVPPLVFVLLGGALAAGAYFFWRSQNHATQATTTPIERSPTTLTRPANNSLSAPSQGDPNSLLTFKLNVDSTPSGAVVLIDRYKKGVTPLRDVPISGGSKRELRVEKDGYTPFVQSIELTQNRNFTVALSKAPPTPTPPATQPTQASTITLRFQGRSWIKVSDANGKVLFQGIPEVGSSQTFPSPITVRAGRPDVISAVVNGTTRGALGDANAATIRLP